MQYRRDRKLTEVMSFQNICVVLSQIRNPNRNQTYGERRDYIVTQSYGYKVYLCDSEHVANECYLRIVLKTRSLKDVNGVFYYFCPCRCGFVYDKNLVPYRVISVENVRLSRQVVLQDFEIRQGFIDKQLGRQRRQPHVLQQMIGQPKRFRMPYLNVRQKLRERAPHESRRRLQDVNVGHAHVVERQEHVWNPQVADPLQNLVVPNEFIEPQQVVDDEREEEDDKEEEEEQEHKLVPNGQSKLQQMVPPELQEQKRVVADKREEEVEENDDEKEVQVQEHILIADEEEEIEREEGREYVEGFVEKGEEQKPLEVSDDEDEEKEHELFGASNGQEREEEQKMMPPPLQEQQRVVADEREEEVEGKDDDKEEDGRGHMMVADEEEEREREEEQEYLEISDEEEGGEEESLEVSDDEHEEEEQDYSDFSDDETGEEQEQEYMVLPHLEVKQMQSNIISSTTLDDSDIGEMFMDDYFLTFVNKRTVIQSTKISSTVIMEGDDELDSSTDTADEF